VIQEAAALGDDGITARTVAEDFIEWMRSKGYETDVPPEWIKAWEFYCQ